MLQRIGDSEVNPQLSTKYGDDHRVGIRRAQRSESLQQSSNSETAAPSQSMTSSSRAEAVGLGNASAEYCQPVCGGHIQMVWNEQRSERRTV